ncbi:hypothetical protein I316_06834 [Kwoniella heveanensis BCC8398]|uniref:Carboxy-cis,cis-muconate cyclase n=1 Tax=Kwoniella heveanensis BCC8398 TaxID=1296120 RepID=A0A1B9GK07_9TREE|nr:hypothetical protein I316_06834 [Kwoniella heveanensis BCC8398]
MSDSVHRYTLILGSYKELTDVGVVTLETNGLQGKLTEYPALSAGQGPTWISSGTEKNTVLVYDASEIRLYSFTRAEDGSVKDWTCRSCIQPPGWKRIVHGGLTADDSIVMAVDYGASQARTFGIENKDLSSELAISTVEYPGQGGYAPLQYAAHPHGIYEHPSKPWVYVSDMGADLVHFHLLEPSGKLEHQASFATPPCSGPRHLAIHPSGRALYTVNEISLTISTFTIDETDGSLTLCDQDPSILPSHIDLKNPGFNKPDGSRGMQGAEILIPRDGKHVYASYRDSPNNQEDGIAVFEIEQTPPYRLKPDSLQCISTQGHWPRGMQFEPQEEGLLAVANQESHS